MLKLCLLLAGSALVPAAAPSQAPQAADKLLAEFQNPPAEARPRVWWHWMNGNISEDGIAKDLAWMQRVGIAGVQNFDANLRTPQVVDRRLVYMTAEWKDAFRFTAQEADRLGLELAIAASPGWSETGGPWVKPEDGLKKLVWSQTEMTGGRPFTGKLAPPPAVTGPYQAVARKASAGVMGTGSAEPAAPVHYTDVAVLALPSGTQPVAEPVARDGAGRTLNAAALHDDDLGSEYEVPASGSAEAPRMIVYDYGRQQTVRSARLFAPKAALPLSAHCSCRGSRSAATETTGARSP